MENAKFKPIRVFYRGTVPGETKRIKEPFEAAQGLVFVARSPESARMYGESIETIRALPEANILYQESSEFWKLLGKRRPPNSHLASVAGGMINNVNTIIKRATSAGYDAVSFSHDADVGTVILNLAAFLREANNPLIETDAQRDWMLDEKINTVVLMHPADFIFLTVPNNAYVDKIKREAKSLDQYNEYIRSGETQIPPMLKVDIKTGVVVGHEGRHRAAALLVNKETEMNVAIKLVDDFTGSRQRSVFDMPPVWYGEFDQNRKFDARKLLGIIRANVQHQYQNSPQIDDVAMSMSELMNENPPDEISQLTRGLRRAKAAGDRAAMEALSAEIKRLRGSR